MEQKKPTQKDLIRSFLQAGRKITPMVALNEFGCFSLAQRIKELRREGLHICTTFKKDQNTNKVFAEYSLIKEQ
ncbi:MAG: hypothetical protein J6X92_02820 [Bacteroidales bacterium]|nr:hypothetical protein [Bacteroidales bacterium]